MTQVYQAETRLEAWVQATKPLLDRDFMQDIILHVDSPSKNHDLEDEVHSELEENYKEANMDPINTIAETIFPAWLYNEKGGSIEDVYDEYLDQLDIILSRSRGYNWGTYFERMIECKDPETGGTFNPLQKTIEKLERANGPEGHPYKACYEINLHRFASDIAVYDGHKDGNRPMNLPCLSHLSFKLFDGEIHLTVLYRSHEYRFKVPGNLLGLARLQSCVAREINADIGPLVVHSSKAYINDEPPKGPFRKVVENTSDRMDHHSLDDF